MVDKIHYRWDFIGLSTDAKPTPSDSPKVVDGSTYYESNTSKLYVFYKDTWYEKTAAGGGGGSSYTAGNGIDITNNEISVDTETIQPKLTAGTNITIDQDNVISAEGGGATYTAGNGIDITNDEISVDTTTIQPKLTAGSNITITDNTIAATDTTYSAFTGTDGTAAGTAGLVPAPATTDAGKFLKADGTWDTAGGGSGPTVVQTPGTSTTDVMSQNGVTSMIFADPATMEKIKIGAGTSSSEGIHSIEIGHNSGASGNTSVACGYGAAASAPNGVAIGTSAFASSSNGATAIGANAYVGSSAVNGIAISGGWQAAYAEGTGAINIGGGGNSRSVTGQGAISLGIFAPANSVQGKIEVGSTNTSYGYNSSNYRLLSGLYDGQSAHDAATLVQGNTLATSAPTTATVGVLGQLYTDTTNMHTYQCTAIDTTDPANPSYTWTQRW